MGLPRQECWTGWPFHSPRDRPNPGIKPKSPALQADSSLTEPPAPSPSQKEHTGLFHPQNAPVDSVLPTSLWSLERPHRPGWLVVGRMISLLPLPSLLAAEVSEK